MADDELMQFMTDRFKEVIEEVGTHQPVEITDDAILWKGVAWDRRPAPPDFTSTLVDPVEAAEKALEQLRAPGGTQREAIIELAHGLAALARRMPS